MIKCNICKDTGIEIESNDSDFGIYKRNIYCNCEEGDKLFLKDINSNKNNKFDDKKK